MPGQEVASLLRISVHLKEQGIRLPGRHTCSVLFPIYTLSLTGDAPGHLLVKDAVGIGEHG